MVSRKVNFFFVGFPKSGSTLFWNMLREHPEIYSSPIKELNYFNIDHQEIIEKNLGKNFFKEIKDERDYEKLYVNPNSLFNGDFNPSYIYSQEAPRLIFNYNKNAKIIISIREPVSYIRSTHFQNLYNLIEDEEDLQKALVLEEIRKQGNHIPKKCVLPFLLYYSELIRYKKFISHFVNSFPIDNIKIILFNDILEDKIAVYKELLEFIGVSDKSFIPSESDRNPSHKLRLIFMRKILLTPAVKKAFFLIIPKKMMPQCVKFSHKLFKEEAKKPTISEEKIKDLKSRFRNEILILNDYLTKKGLISVDLNNIWKY